MKRRTKYLIQLSFICIEIPIIYFATLFLLIVFSIIYFIISLVAAIITLGAIGGLQIPNIDLGITTFIVTFVYTMTRLLLSFLIFYSGEEKEKDKGNFISWPRGQTPWFKK